MRTASPADGIRSRKGAGGGIHLYGDGAAQRRHPARQVYTSDGLIATITMPGWRLWAEGQWYFLGACEPEEVLNKGMVFHASSRALLVHSRIFQILPERKPEGMYWQGGRDLVL